jgi:hypothetical protein
MMEVWWTIMTYVRLLFFRKRGVLFLVLILMSLTFSCSSRKKEGAESGQVQSLKTNFEIKKLQSKFKSQGLTEGEKQKLKVLNEGGSARRAELAEKLYEKGLSDIEAAELKYLAAGASDREAFLKAKKDTEGLNALEANELRKIQFNEDSSSLGELDKNLLLQHAK